jgi:hypothetical protein
MQEVSSFKIQISRKQSKVEGLRFICNRTSDSDRDFQTLRLSTLPTPCRMIIDHAGGLHEGVGNG